ncbi:MAG: hypothetical protein IJ191_05905 [Treponema sp.]|nr:hypothetical protein [Treponema sp.]
MTKNLPNRGGTYDRAAPPVHCRKPSFKTPVDIGVLYRAPGSTVQRPVEQEKIIVFPVPL